MKASSRRCSRSSFHDGAGDLARRRAGHARHQRQWRARARAGARRAATCRYSPSARRPRRRSAARWASRNVRNAQRQFRTLAAAVARLGVARRWSAAACQRRRGRRHARDAAQSPGLRGARTPCSTRSRRRLAGCVRAHACDADLDAALFFSARSAAIFRDAGGGGETLRERRDRGLHQRSHRRCACSAYASVKSASPPSPIRMRCWHVSLDLPLVGRSKMRSIFGWGFLRRSPTRKSFRCAPGFFDLPTRGRYSGPYKGGISMRRFLVFLLILVALVAGALWYFSDPGYSARDAREAKYASPATAFRHAAGRHARALSRARRQRMRRRCSCCTARTPRFSPGSRGRRRCRTGSMSSASIFPVTG